MRHDEYSKTQMSDTLYMLNNVPALSHDETMGQILVEILRAGVSLNRRNLCTKLLSRIENAKNADEEKRYHELIRLVLERDS